MWKIQINNRVHYFDVLLPGSSDENSSVMKISKQVNGSFPGLSYLYLIWKLYLQIKPKFSPCHSISNGTLTKISHRILSSSLTFELRTKIALETPRCWNDAESVNETKFLIGIRIKPILNIENTRESFFLLLPLSLSLPFSRSRRYKNKSEQREYVIKMVFQMRCSVR